MIRFSFFGRVTTAGTRNRALSPWPTFIGNTLLARPADFRALAARYLLNFVGERLKQGFCERDPKGVQC